MTTERQLHLPLLLFEVFMERHMELLSPAGNREALSAAIACGADAVYLGLTSFGARSYAGNFDGEGLMEAVRYAHERERRVYVTVNTLVLDREMTQLRDALALIRDAGADAVLVQDLGVAALIAREFPELLLHASTQMTVHNVQGVQKLKDLGFSRVVPARECTLAELRRMADTGMEIEAFAHGALCVCVSGQCLFSSMVGGRSGNRGKCAQPCRLPYRMQNGERGYLLSPRDLMLIEHLPELLHAGVCSLKLEGRMKKPEYVAVVTSCYRRALDDVLQGREFHLDEPMRRDLEQIFNRGGFTRGYVLGENDAALMSRDKPNHQGVRVGTVTLVQGDRIRVRTTLPLCSGDLLQLRGRRETDVTYTRPDCPAGEIILNAAPGTCRAGDGVWRLTSREQQARARERMSTDPRMPLTGEACFEDGRLILILSDAQGHSGSAEICGLESADKPKEAEATLRRQLSRMGDAPYRLEALSLKGGVPFLPVSMANALRREALEKLRLARLTRPVSLQRRHFGNHFSPDRQPLLMASGPFPELAPDLLDAGADVFIWCPEDWREETLSSVLERTPVPLAVELPVFADSPETTRIFHVLGKYRSRIVALRANNIAHLETDGIPLWGGQGLNVTNRESARFFIGEGCRRVTLSCELGAAQIRDILQEDGGFDLEVYGRSRLMLLSHCPVRTRSGASFHDPGCRLCREARPVEQLTDRMGAAFPLVRVRMSDGCRIQVLNSVVTDLSGMPLMPCGWILRFTDETPERCLEIVRSFASMKRGGKALHLRVPGATTGHWKRGLE